MPPLPPDQRPESENCLAPLDQALRRLDRPAAIQLLTELGERLQQHCAELMRQEERRKDLFERIRHCGDYAELKTIEQSLTRLEARQFQQSWSVPGLQRGCTSFRDLLGDRVCDLVASELEAQGWGSRPRPFALISMGSDGREEQTLITDQDYLIVYGDGPDDSADPYFEAFSTLLVERLTEVGFGRCSGDIMPSNPTWRGSCQQWRARLLAISRYEYEEYSKNLMDLIVLSDARFVCGNRTLARELIGLIHAFEASHFQVLWGMARAATDMTVGLGWWGRIRIERSGSYRGLFNVKLFGWAPLVMNVRILAVHSGLLATNTLQRISLLARGGALAPAHAAALEESYHVLTRLRIRAQLEVLYSGGHSSHHLDPTRLDPAERLALRQALASIKELQQMIRINFATL